MVEPEQKPIFQEILEPPENNNNIFEYKNTSNDAKNDANRLLDKNTDFMQIPIAGGDILINLSNSK